MSKAVSALMGARADGYCLVEEAGLVGMITLRGDLSSAALAKAVKAATGAAMPGQGEIATGSSGKVAWMSPDELLLIVEHAKAPEITANVAKALAKEHALVVNVSDARAVFRISGEAVREVLAKLSPVDMGAMAPGQIRRSRIAQVAAAFYLEDEQVATLISFRSVAQYAFDLLADAAMQGGEVGI